MIDLGTVRPGATIRIPFSSFDKDDGSSITMTNFAVGDILIYKDGDTTARASTSGFTATTDFSSKTGKHLAIIDLADNTTADFYAAGSEYLVAIDSVTVDGVTTGGWIARFRIGYPGAVFDTTIASLSNQTSFTLTTGPAEDDALNDHEVWIHDAASAVQRAAGIIIDYTGSTKTVTLGAAPTFTVAAKDNISVMGPRHGSNNPIPSLVMGFIGTLLSEGAAGRIAAAFQTMFNVASSVFTTASVNQTGDTYARIGANGAGLTDLGGMSTTMKAQVEAEVDDALGSGNGSALTSIPWNASWDAEVQSEVSDELTARGITSAFFSGITSLAQWLGLIAGKQTGDATALTEIKATGAGSGGYDPTSDSQEAIRDNMGTAQTGDAYAVVSSGTHGNAALKLLIDTVDTVVDAILLDTGTDGVVVAAGSKSGYALTSGERDSIAAALLDLAAGVETNRTLRQAMRLLLAASVGKLSGAATTTVAIRDTNDSKDRITATVDANGNRSAVALDAT